MTQTIRWVKDFESDVGSILIYRGTTKDGSYTLIDTIGAKDGSGNWVGSYSDSIGTVDSWYKIQTWNGTGSSDYSDPISGEFWYLFAELEDVKDELRLSSLADISDREIYQSIVDADDWIFTEYGDPIKKTYTYMSAGSYTYDITGDRSPIYRVDRVEYENSGGVGARLETGSFSVNYRDGEVTVDSNIIDTNDGRRIEFEFVPKAYHLLSKYKAALYIAESNLLTDGDVVDKPGVARLQRKFDQIVDAIRPKAVYSDAQVAKLGGRRGPGEYIEQEWPGNPW